MDINDHHNTPSNGFIHWNEFYSNNSVNVSVSITHLCWQYGGVNSSPLTVSTQHTWHLRDFLYPIVTNIITHLVFIHPHHLHHHSRPPKPTYQNAKENAWQEAFLISLLVIIREERDERGEETKEIFNILTSSKTTWFTG